MTQLHSTYVSCYPSKFILTPHKWVSFHYALIHSLLSHLCIKLMVHRYLPCTTTTLLHIVGMERGISCITQVYTSWTPLHSTLVKFTWQEGVLFLPSLSENKWSTVCGTVAVPPPCRRLRRAPWSQRVAASASEASAFAWFTGKATTTRQEGKFWCSLVVAWL